MGKVVGDVLGLAAGVAISPLPIIAIILILATPRGRLNGPSSPSAGFWGSRRWAR